MVTHDELLRRPTRNLEMNRCGGKNAQFGYLSLVFPGVFFSISGKADVPSSLRAGVCPQEVRTGHGRAAPRPFFFFPALGGMGVGSSLEGREVEGGGTWFSFFLGDLSSNDSFGGLDWWFGHLNPWFLYGEVETSP